MDMSMHRLWLIKRDFPGKRWVSILLRTAHLIGIAGLAGLYLFGLPAQTYQGYLLLAVLSGALMVVKEIYCNPVWLMQLRGQAIIIKLALLSLGWWLASSPEAGIYLTVIIISGIVAHAPGKVRYYSLWHRRVVTRDQFAPSGTVKDCGEP